MYVHSLKRDININKIGHGNSPLFIIGPASLFKKSGMLSPKFQNQFTIYFLDLFTNETINSKQVQSYNYSEITLYNFIEAIETIRRRLSLNHIYIFAHSAMGILAINYALKYSQHIAANILIGLSPDWTAKKNIYSNDFLDLNADQQRNQLYNNDQHEIAKIVSNNPLDQNLFYKKYYSRRALYFYNPTDNSNNKLWENINLDVQLVDRYFNLINGVDLRTLLKNKDYNIPTALILGLYDFSCPLTLWTDFYRDVLSKFDYYIFENSAHFPMKEESDFFFKYITDFINKNAKTDSNYTPRK